MKKENEIITGNKGEWSEIYVLFKLLSEGQLFAADENLKMIATEVIKILAAHREDIGSTVDYEIIKCKKVKTSNSKIATIIPVAEFKKFSLKLLEEIKGGAKTFGIVDEELKKFVNDNLITSIKNKKLDVGKNKSDLDLSFIDAISGSKLRMGFSIKSKIGSPATLFNASASSGLKFLIAGNLNKADIDHINNDIDGAKTRVGYLTNTKGCKLKFDQYKDENFPKNLRMVDADLIQIVPEIVKLFYITERKAQIDYYINELNKNDFLHILESKRPYYEQKVMNLLTACALGLTASEPWGGLYDATGGIIIAIDTGEVLCYYFYKWNEFKKFLLNDTHFDIPSTSDDKSFDFGKIYYDPKGLLSFDLNFQIRFN